MRVDVFINKNAGRSGQDSFSDEIRQALYRCDLHFHAPSTVNEMQESIRTLLPLRPDALLICGGDGTFNAAIKPIVESGASQEKIPALLNIPVGTANDLAWETGISRRIKKAARSLFDGHVETVDVLEVTAGGKSRYMITNGGIGIPAQTAAKANIVRSWVGKKAQDPSLSPFKRGLLKLAKKGLTRLGSGIYELILVEDMVTWDKKKWEAEIEIPGKTSFSTQAPFILINNQPTVGGNFTPAPFTSNRDGTFNITLVNPTRLLPMAKEILDMRLGRIPNLENCPSFEAREVRIKVKPHSKPITFFGDGEILHENVREITIRCVHPGLPIISMREQ